MGSCPHAAAPRRRLTAAALVLALAIASGVAARAEDEVPAAVHALDTPDAASRDASRAAFVARADADEVVVTWLRDSSRRAQLTEREIVALIEIAADRGVRLANSGLRSLVRDGAQPRAVRETAARALGRTGSVADVGALGDGLAEMPDACCRSLAAIGGDAAVSVLRHAAVELKIPEAEAGLAKLGDGSGLASLVARLEDAAQRDRAAELLRWATGRDLPADPAPWRRLVVRRELAARFASADHDAAQAAVAETAERLRAAEGRTDLSEDLAAIVADPTSHVFARAKAALALGLAGDASRNDVLLAATADGQPGDVRWAAANALARVGDLSIAVPFAKMLVHDEDRERLAAKRTNVGQRLEFVPVDPELVRALHRVGIRGGTVEMINLLAGEYRTGLHREALFAIREVAGGEMFGLQPDGTRAERLAAVAKIRAWWADARERIPVPPPAADDPGWPAFRRGVNLLVAELGAFKFLHNMRAKAALVIVAEAAEPELVAALANADLHVRMGAAEVVERTALRRFATPLAARLAAEPNPAARTRILAALEVCGRRAPDGTVPGGETTQGAVRKALSDRDLDIRIAAARVLGILGDAADVRRLHDARAEPRNENRAFRVASAAGLMSLSDFAAAEDVLAELRSDEVLRRTEGAALLRRTAVPLHGFDPAGPAEARAAAIRAIEADVSSRIRK